MQPQLWMIGGPNGAGKSTLVARWARGRLPIVNPDEIALTLPQGPDRDFEAGKLALRFRREHLAARRSFAVETTSQDVVKSSFCKMRERWATSSISSTWA